MALSVRMILVGSLSGCILIQVWLNLEEYPCKSVQLSSGPTTHGTNMIVKLEAVIYYDAKEFDAGFR